MGYWSYVGGFCRHCGEDMGFIEAYGGRTRRFCNDACRQAAHREKTRRTQTLARHAALCRYWQEHCITGEVLLALQDILVAYGKDAAKEATEAVLLAVKQHYRHRT